ncbi:hypothetical protein [Hyphomicrobium sp. CS1GBMeth3]|uniref:hypothetical protein n=1 Tax=Hyphomicrobium sp. CS1GBMeth3 TaxID=1892845 RepID=UPI000A799829|nr:hypothetical protein [Hyphomicrobium sp. CS1GBMeth3]
MSFLKSTLAATAAIAMVLASLGAPTVAYAKKGKHGHHHHGHHHHHHKHKRGKYYRYGAGAAAAAAIIGTAAYYDCKKWKDRYKRTGNRYFLDRYYACRY